MPVGSNAKRISEITEAFSKIDPNDKRTYDAPRRQIPGDHGAIQGWIYVPPLKFFPAVRLEKKVNVFFLFLVKISVFYCKRSKYMVKTT